MHRARWLAACARRFGALAGACLRGGYTLHLRMRVPGRALPGLPTFVAGENEPTLSHEESKICGYKLTQAYKPIVLPR